MHVVVLGGGYAGISLTRRLEHALPEEVRISLVDDTGEHLIQHQIHRLIRYPELAEQLRIPLEELLDRAEVIEARVTAIDPEAAEVTFESGEVIAPDYLGICLGAVTADHGVPGVSAHGQPLKRVGDAGAIRARYQTLDSGDRVVIGGAGLSGIQVAGELAAMDGETEIVLLEQEATVAPSFPAAFQGTVRDALENAGVEVRTETTIRGATDHAILLAGERDYDYDQFIWTGGISGRRAMGGMRPAVRADLRLADRVVALGDAVVVTDDRGAIVPASAQTAVRQSETAAVNLGRLVEADLSGDLVFEPRLDRYRDTSPGWVVSVGDDAVALLGDRVIRGAAARTVKTSVWLHYLSSIGRIHQSLEAIAEKIGNSAAGE